MTALQQIAARSLYIPGANNLGVVATSDGGAIAIDTGIDKDTGRTLRKALDAAKLQLRAIISTHHHADHIGGNDVLVRNVPGVEVYASRGEAPLIENPLLEPIYLNMGAQPIAALQTKWLMAKGVPVNHLIMGDSVEVEGVRFDVLALPGHSIAQIGVAVDGVCFAADGFFGTAVLQKHGIPYAHNIGQQLTSLTRLAERHDDFFVPGHGELTPRAALGDAIAANRAAIERATDALYDALSEPGDLYAVARRVQAALELTFGGLPQYAIFVSVVAAHLSYLEAQQRARVALEAEGIIWYRT